MSTPSRELLIVAPERWDEACFSVPAVRALAGSGMGIGVLCQAHQKAFWETLPGLAVHTPSTLQEPWQVALMWEPGDLVKVVRKSGIHKRIGPEVGKLGKQLTETLKDQPHPTEHRVQFYLKAVAEMGVETAKPEYFSPIYERPATETPAILLCPDSDFGTSHEWDFGNWLGLPEKLEELSINAQVTCINPAGSSAALCGAMPGKCEVLEIDLKQPDLKKLAEFDVLIAADGSLPHLAAHLGATCITLFGPNDAQWKRPLGKRHQVVHQPVECSPCLMANCPLDMRCQKELKADAVLKAFEQVIG